MVSDGRQYPGDRPKRPDSEKITINLGYVDLGHIDLLVQEGFYSNRTDFQIRDSPSHAISSIATGLRRSSVPY